MRVNIDTVVLVDKQSQNATLQSRKAAKGGDKRRKGEGI